MAKEDAPQKGVAGKGTGAKTREAIRTAQMAGCSLKEIADASDRSVSVISAIKAGTIKNPPSDVAGDIQKGCASAVRARNQMDDDK